VLPCREVNSLQRYAALGWRIDKKDNRQLAIKRMLATPVTSSIIVLALKREAPAIH